MTCRLLVRFGLVGWLIGLGNPLGHHLHSLLRVDAGQAPIVEEKVGSKPDCHVLTTERGVTEGASHDAILCHALPNEIHDLIVHVQEQVLDSLSLDHPHAVDVLEELRGFPRSQDVVCALAQALLPLDVMQVVEAVGLQPCAR